MTPDDPRHGTNAGAVAHAFAHQPPCPPCRQAAADYRRNLRARRYLKRVPRLYIDSTGTIRRIHALQALGWRLTDIDTLIGHKPGTNYTHNLTRQTRVHIDTARKIAAAYDQLSMKLGPSERTRKTAQRRGWATPLAWDDDKIDNPDARPHSSPARPPRGDDIDPVAVHRAVLGEHITLTRAERHEAIRRWSGSLHALEKLRPDWNIWRDLKDMRAEEQEAS